MSKSTYTEIPWVDLQCFGHIARDAHELGQNKWTLLRTFLGYDELHRCRVHAVAERSDDTKIGHGEKSVELVLLDCLVAVETSAFGRLMASMGTY